MQISQNQMVDVSIQELPKEWQDKFPLGVGGIRITKVLKNSICGSAAVEGQELFRQMEKDNQKFRKNWLKENQGVHDGH